MSSKSRHKRGKHSLQAKKRKDRLTPTPAAGAPVAGATHAPVAPLPTVTPPVSAPASKTAPAAASGYPHVTGELKRIGIIAAIMLAVLIILSQVLP